MKDPNSDHRHEVALFRYGLIADLVHLPPGTKGLYQRLQDKAAAAYCIPGSSRTRVAPETLRDWLKGYRQGGFDALMPKPRTDRGRSRGLGIATVKDRVVQTALKLVLEPIFEKDFRPVSFGFRPERSAKDALRVVDQALKNGYTWVVDADLQSYFDTIPKEPLLARVKERVSDHRVLELLKRFLEQDVMEGMKRWTPMAGTPQGSVISPLMSNLYLHGLDVLLSEAGHTYARFADDFVVLCRTRQEAKAVLATIRTWVDQNGLRLHPDKTRVGNCMEKGQGFEFLGYRFEAGRRWVRPKSREALRDKIRQKTGRTRSGSLESIIMELNSILRGWFGYFQQAHRSTFRDVDGFVRRRLRAILRKREKRPGFGRTSRDHQRWPNAFFAERRLFTLHEAQVRVRQSR